MKVNRQMEAELLALIKEYPVTTILGPRQAGKTTLARMALPDYHYVNLEDPETCEFAVGDPKGFMASLRERCIIDEIQRVPQLLSYIQVAVDAQGFNGKFVLTGSHQLSLRETISQSLAGRTALLHLLPFSLSELASAGIKFESFEDGCFTGFLPRVHEQAQRPHIAYANYYQSYVERDVRQLIQLRDASVFEKMLKLMAGRVGQVFDYSSMANDVGVDAKTIRNWISILEASFIIFKLPPYFENFGKRVIKSPKYYFTEPGLLCFLLGIREPSQITRDPLVGSIFENLIVVECLKARYNRGYMADLYFFRDSKGNEVDLLVEKGRALMAIEIKSAATFSLDQLKGLRRFQSVAQKAVESILVYRGVSKETSDGFRAISFSEVETLFL